MMKATPYTQASALPAIAAALALLSTPALAQQAQPTPDQPTTDVPAPATQAQPDVQATPAPAESTSTAATPDSATTPVAAKPKAARAAPRRAAAGTKSTASDRVRTTHVPLAAPVTAPPAEATATPAPAPAAPTVIDRTPAKPAASVPATRAISSNDTALELGGGAIAILALGGAAFAIARRRRRQEEEQWYGQEATREEYAEPVAATKAEPLESPVAKEQPAIIAPAAFAWGNNPRRAQPEEAGDGSDRRPGESWVERAYRGQSPANPSASLRARLKRAAFFDKREREVAAGKAEPVETGAGLPDVLAEERPAEAEREFA